MRALCWGNLHVRPAPAVEKSRRHGGRLVPGLRPGLQPEGAFYYYCFDSYDFIMLYYNYIYTYIHICIYVYTIVLIY